MAIKLSDKQREIVDYTDGPVLVKAGPGSGKTRVLIERIKRLVSLQKRTKVLALTFSNMAAEEMKSRILSDLGDDDYADNVTLGTIHSFCLDIVQTRGHLIGLPTNLTLFENAEDRKRVLRDAIMSDPDLKEQLESNGDLASYLSNCLNSIAGYKKAFILPNDASLTELDAWVYARYNEALLLQGAIDFDDILFYAYRILSENKSVARIFTTQYKYICVDEAQDLNYAQYEVIKAICGESFRNIMLVGDENQSIYGFNGSDSSLMCVRFVDDFCPKVFLLNENFRSAKAIVSYANKLQNSDDYPNCYYEGELTFSSYGDEAEEANAILQKIQFLSENGHKDVEGKITYSDIAIIARNRYAFSKIEEVLTQNCIPYYFKRTIAGIESESSLYKLFDLELRLLSNPRDIIHAKERTRLVLEMQNNAIPGFVKSCIEKLEADQFNLAPVLQEIDEWAERSCSDDDEKYLILNDGALWKQHWVRYSSQVPRESRTITSFRNNVALGKTQAPEEKCGISLLTAHMSKGLQYEVVFIIGLSEGTFPDYRAVQAGGKAIEQEKNNMFVAVTRAKRLCYLSYAQYKEMPWGSTKFQYPSRFIREQIAMK